LEATTKRLDETNVSRDSGGFIVRVLTPPRARGPKPRPDGQNPEAAPDADLTGKEDRLRRDDEGRAYHGAGSD
jgi:hypothetical protein